MRIDPGSEQGAIGKIRLVCVALALGLVGFTVVALVLGPKATPGGGGGGLVSASLMMASFVAGVSALVVPVALRKTIVAATVKRIDAGMPEEELVETVHQGYATQTLLRAAMGEGLGLIGGLGIWVTAEPAWAAVPAVGVVLIGLALPTRAKLEAFEREVLDAMG
ncbi:MAG: hypothetical protein HRU70_05220 [Phycisphaeraceae bacterium]|nr:MAG: hypothetical protein HRU70_05220 [Phycisphaeraceae bacterium]